MRISLILILTAIISILAFFNAVGSITQTKNPSVALKFWPVNGIAEQTSAIAALKPNLTSDDSHFPYETNAMVFAGAVRSFKSEPHASSAVALMALKFDDERRGKLMDLAQQLSRRETVSMAWSIFDSGERGDLASLLHFYDLSMRTSRTSSISLIPALVSVMGQDGFSEPMLKILSKNPPWAGQFWKSASNTKQALVNTAKLRMSMELKKQKMTGNMHSNDLILNLVRNNHFEIAEHLHSQIALSPDSKKSLIRSSKFEVDPVYPPLDWDLSFSGKYSTSIDSNDHRMRISIVPGADGVLVRQLLHLEPGEYAFSTSTFSQSIPNNMIMLNIRCGEPGLENSYLLNTPLKGKQNKYSLLVPDDRCRHYWLEIGANPNETKVEQDIDIKELSLVRI